jgi:hypothetical protein
MSPASITTRASSRFALLPAVTSTPASARCVIRRLLKKAAILTRPTPARRDAPFFSPAQPRRAETRLSARKAAPSYLIIRISQANDAGGLFQQPISIKKPSHPVFGEKVTLQNPAMAGALVTSHSLLTSPDEH